MIHWAEPNIIQEDIDYTKEILKSGWYSMGKQVSLLEQKMKHIADRNNAIAVNNGTSALTISLRALGVEHGDEVIVPALSYIASATAVNLVGAKPIFVDVKRNMTIDVEKIKEKITGKTGAIIAVDFGGNPCDHSRLRELGDFLRIPILVDGAQSIGATHNNKPCLSYGDISTTSFHAAKQITTVEGGMIFTDNDGLANEIKKIRNQGESETKYVHEVIGGNYRMTDVLASLAIKQIDRYKQYMKYRDLVIEFYKTSLRHIVDFLDYEGQGNFMFSILTSKRDEIAELLKKNEVETRHYPRTIPQQPIYNERENYPMAEMIVKHMLSLPVHHNLTNNDLYFICDKIKEVY